MDSNTSFYPPSEIESNCYYSGLPSCPRLIARSGAIPWEEPRPGPWMTLTPKELSVVGNHPLKDVWEDSLAPKLHALLDSMTVKWTSIDVVRIGEVGASNPPPVVLWIGVMPNSLSGNDGLAIVSKCVDILGGYKITTVDVEIRESLVTRLAGPKLYKPDRSYRSKETVDLREPLTATLGLPICAQSTPGTQGTGGFYITEGGNTEKVLLVTSRHAVFPPYKSQNTLFNQENKNEPRQNVTLFGDEAFQRYLKSTEDKVRDQASTADYQQERLQAIKEKSDERSKKAYQRLLDELADIETDYRSLKTLSDDISTLWATPESRLLGHVILSPPISGGAGSSSEGYSEDWAVIEVDSSKIDSSNFKGNTIDLGTVVPSYDVKKNMQPHSFQYPYNRLMKLQGTIPVDEMRRPITLDQDGTPCMKVLKRGSSSGLTFGRANDVFSYVRTGVDQGNTGISKEWVILPLRVNDQNGKKIRPFSTKGDSGSVVVDAGGRIGGLITSAAGHLRSSDDDCDLDLTYATPVSFLLQRMQEYGIQNPNINPVLTVPGLPSDDTSNSD